MKAPLANQIEEYKLASFFGFYDLKWKKNHVQIYENQYNIYNKFLSEFASYFLQNVQNRDKTC